MTVSGGLDEVEGPEGFPARALASGEVEFWRACATATAPAERAAAEAGVRLAYRRAGLAEPERVLWADSPRAAVTLMLGLEDKGPSVREEIRTKPWALERDRLHEELGPAGWSAHWGATGGRLWESTRTLVDRISTGLLNDLCGAGDTADSGDTVGAGGAAEAGGAGGAGIAAESGGAAGTGGASRSTGRGSAADRAQETAIRLLLLDAVLGQHDAPWLAAFPTDRAPLDGLGAVCRSAGWWWPFASVAVVCERPVALHRDEAGRLDRGDGPALAYRDGFALHAWRGMPVPAAFLAELSTLTPDRIRAEENAELRRVMLEYYGYERYLADSGARPLHSDETGTLWRIDLNGDEPVVMVEVLNSTPEPDGTRRTYWLRVPPSTRTARQGVAWTFGLDADVYAPVRET
ncbi:DUF6745 domain-containing protein [Streptomyces sp. NPDC092370]|uniref:DUF6745 domain-containing protein n=1 Tax=Streptomyces sp. NPDC092370 TaxID=3366016 RepID=UPI0037FDEBF2